MTQLDKHRGPPRAFLGSGRQGPLSFATISTHTHTHTRFPIRPGVLENGPHTKKRTPTVPHHRTRADCGRAQRALPGSSDRVAQVASERDSASEPLREKRRASLWARARASESGYPYRGAARNDPDGLERCTQRKNNVNPRDNYCARRKANIPARLDQWARGRARDRSPITGKPRDTALFGNGKLPGHFH